MAPETESAAATVEVASGGETGKPDGKSSVKNSKPSWHRQARWRERNPLKRWAHVATNSAIKKGLLVRPDRCERCGASGKTEAHHADHRLVLQVEFLCAPCHRRHHARLRKAGGG